MKKLLSFFLATTIVIGLLITSVNAEDSQVRVNLNGQYMKFDQPPVIIDGRTLVPLRAIFEGLGACVTWDEDTQTVTAKRENTIVKIAVGDNRLFVDDVVIALDVPAQIVGGRTLVPIRAVSNAFGGVVDWDNATKTVKIENECFLPVEITVTDAIHGDFFAEITYGENGEIYCEDSEGSLQKYLFDEQGTLHSDEYYFYNDNHSYNKAIYDTAYLEKLGLKITYDEDNNVMYYEGSSGYTEEYIFDDNGNIILAENSNGRKVEIVYKKIKVYPAVVRFIANELELWEGFHLWGIRCSN